MVGAFLLICLIVFLVRKFLDRHTPRVGGRIGRWRPTPAEVEVPGGFSDVACREITLFGARAEGAAYPNFRTFLRQGTFARTALTHVYRVAGCSTVIEFPVEPPDYQRIDAAEALALLRELPDPRMVRRLHVSDEFSFLDPWLRQVSKRELRYIGHANSAGLVVLYRPDRAHRSELASVLLHEWLHLVAFKSGRTLRRFNRAHAIEQLEPLTFPMLSFGAAGWKQNHEAWSDLGELIVGADDAAAQRAAMAAPLHSLILWQEVENIFRKVPKNFASTRLIDLEARAAYMRNEVAPKARNVRKKRR